MFADFERIAAVLETLPERKLAIAYSGGVDSVTLARSAEIILGKENILLLFADSIFAPAREKAFALEWAEARKLKCIKVPFAPLELPQVAANNLDRCYFCKKALFTLLKQTAAQHGFNTLADGENLDDQLDYRPGSKAADELGVRHIFVEAELNKAMIRDLAHDFALPNSQAPASACLASRVPCNCAIEPEKLLQIDQAENILLDLGFAGSRVRSYGDLAKIEVAVEDMEKFWKLRKVVQEKLLATGFRRIAVDLAGYSRGAVNGISGEDLQ
ncbi:MAG: ATP-dependent sacrificial sulfur transferase LarE [Lentisphaerae bacterium]|nr:ATP-dependent sacrificial sulfur transferase LarE [Lentisphaerota bacterium]